MENGLWLELIDCRLKCIQVSNIDRLIFELNFQGLPMTWIADVLQGSSTEFRTETVEPKCEPTAFKARVACDKHTSSVVNVVKQRIDLRLFQLQATLIRMDKIDSSPGFPRCGSLAPKLFELIFISQGVHCRPKTIVLISCKLALGGECL